MGDVRFVLTNYNDKILSYSIDVTANRLESIGFYERQDESSVNIGDIFVAKVMTVASNINAAFIDYQKGRHGYLPFNKSMAPVLVNRMYDGKLKAGDEVLVQLEKEAVRSKEPVFTTNLSISGKYSVITSGIKSRGVSKKCPKSRYNELLEAIPEEIAYGVVVRTNAAELDDLEMLKSEGLELNSQMERLLNEGIHRTCYSRVWKSPAPYLVDLRDMNGIEYSQIITDDDLLYNELSEFIMLTSPASIDKLKKYTDENYSLSKLYSIETKVEELLNKKVWLKSGAYLIIEKTEAMYVIDVNSGKNMSKKANEEYIYSINVEAAKEVMRQIRLRNLTGMILVDFINMNSNEDKERLMDELAKYARRDSVKTIVVDMTALDLVEVTRQKNKSSLEEQLNGFATAKK
jgi:ribonuclease G